MGAELPGWKDKALFTPGPINTSHRVRQAMLHDHGHRDATFCEMVAEIRKKLVELAGGRPDEYTAVLMQGSGTYSLEATVGTAVPPDGKLLVLINGAYGRRIAAIADRLRIPVKTLVYPEDAVPSAVETEQALAEDPAVTHVAVVHCETTSGILNPVERIGDVVHQAGRQYIVDAMSSFGGIPIDVAACHIDYLVSSANKCLEGVPGVAFVIARISALRACEGRGRSVSLDLFSQWKEFEASGQFRFTPPTHVLAALREALAELEEEGGVVARAARYRRNHAILVEGMRAIGFRTYLPPDVQSYIITTFYYPDHPNFSFTEFYDRLREKGYLLYPGKVASVDGFRIGHIGRVGPSDVRALLGAVRDTLAEMRVEL